MRIRPISIAGMSMAVWVTAVLVFVAGWTVPAQADTNKIYVKNKTRRGHNFCTYRWDETDFSNTNEKDNVSIAKNACASMDCGFSCSVMKCGKTSDNNNIHGGQYIKFSRLSRNRVITKNHDNCEDP